MQSHCWVGGTDSKRKTLFGQQQQVLVFKEKEEWLLVVQTEPQEGVSLPTASRADLGWLVSVVEVRPACLHGLSGSS
jgi:hypothetical protein